MNDTRPIISTTDHWFAPMRPRFACWGDRLYFDKVYQLKTRSINAMNDTPSRELLIGSIEILRLVRQQTLKSP